MLYTQHVQGQPLLFVQGQPLLFVQGQPLLFVQGQPLLCLCRGCDICHIQLGVHCAAVGYTPA